MERVAPLHTEKALLFDISPYHKCNSMDTVIQQLELKYAKFLRQRERDNALYSFEPAYEYLTIIETQPVIKEIIDHDRVETAQKWREIVQQNLPHEDLERSINKINRSSLSYFYAEIHRDVYVPRNMYKNSVIPLTQTEIIGGTKLFREKFVSFMYSIGVFILKLFRKVDNKELEAVSALAKIEYTFTQKKYETYMEKIHAMLIPRLLEICTKPKEIATVATLKDKIVISEKKGIYQSGNEQAVYSIGKRTKRFKLIKYLLSKDDCRLSELQEATKQDDTVVMNAVPEITRLFRKNTGLSHDLILHNDTSGYYLNKQDFDIVLEQ